MFMRLWKWINEKPPVSKEPLIDVIPSAAKGLPVLDFPEQKEVKIPTPPIGVGEPVISFVKQLYSHPEDFMWKEKCCRGDIYYKLYDKENKKIFTYSCHYIPYSGTQIFVSDIDFLTSDERSYLYIVHNEYKEMIEKKRKDVQRQEYIDIYCKES